MLLRASAIRLPLRLAVDVPVVSRPAFAQQLSQGAPQGLPLRCAQPELAGELFEGQTLPPRAAKRGEKVLGIDVHEGQF
jgi:hypothetical protein